MSQQHTEQPTLTTAPFQYLLETTEGLTLSGILLVIFFIVLQFAGVKGKGKLARSRFAGAPEKRHAKRLGHHQLEHPQEEGCTLYLGSDRRVLLPDVQRSIAVVGSSGSGKTASCIDPAIDSAIDQGWTGLIYDVKGTLMKRHAHYALQQGYKVYCFAPGIKNEAGEAIGDSLNLLDFMSGPADGAMAEEIASVILANLRPVGSKDDAYFGPNGIALMKSVLMMAKGSESPDLQMAYALLSLSSLAERLVALREAGRLSQWIQYASNGLMSVVGSEKTVSSIVGTAVINFTKLMDPLLLPSLLSSTIPLDLPGKQIVFFQPDEQRLSSTLPLIAAVIHMLVKRNLNNSANRQTPFFVCLDEFTTLRLPDIERWINLHREYKQVCLLSYQSDSQLKMRYSADYADSIIASCGTKVIFSPGPGNTQISQKWATAIGEEEVRVKTQSRSHGRSSSRSVGEQVNKVQLVTPDELERFQSGECVILSPGYKGRPHRLRIPLNQADMARRKGHIHLWHEKISKRLAKRSPCGQYNPDMEAKGSDSIEWEANLREGLADNLLPTAEESQASELETSKLEEELLANVA